MEKMIYGYEKPEIEIIEISVEKGFETSPGEEGIYPGAGNPGIGED